MKALSLHQPWASLIALGAKRIETRSWSTRYRGPLAIHAAKRRIVNELIYFGSCWNFCGALGRRMGDQAPLYEALPFGAVIAVCELVDCRPTDSFTVGELDRRRKPANMPHADLYQWSERGFGDFKPGRYGWVLDNICALPEPIFYRGRQGLFNVDLPLARPPT